MPDQYILEKSKKFIRITYNNNGLYTYLTNTDL